MHHICASGSFFFTPPTGVLIAPSLIDSYQHSVDLTHHFPHDRAISYSVRRDLLSGERERERALTDVRRLLYLNSRSHVREINFPFSAMTITRRASEAIMKRVAVVLAC